MVDKTSPPSVEIFDSFLVVGLCVTGSINPPLGELTSSVVVGSLTAGVAVSELAGSSVLETSGSLVDVVIILSLAEAPVSSGVEELGSLVVESISNIETTDSFEDKVRGSRVVSRAPPTVELTISSVEETMDVPIVVPL